MAKRKKLKNVQINEQELTPTVIGYLNDKGASPLFLIVIFGILFARMTLKSGAPTPTVAGAAGWGLTSGSAFGMLYLVLEKLRTGNG